MNRLEYSVDLDDAVVEILFSGMELPDPYYTNQSIRSAIEKRRVKTKFFKIEECEGGCHETH